ncbi:MAG: 16S rRNA (uracil(1498)-N(3))-methyltransferase [Bacteroidales bacterium]|nr:16S rRNA (uracil(1498)-N(3))-methyltransferase [Bacteroidales bacterium]
MELFYSNDIEGQILTLDEEETRHCVRVLRHAVGEEIFVIDGAGKLLKCILTSTSGKCARAEIVERTPSWGGHPYHLTMAVCPTKNNERFEWFLEKACEIGVDRIVPLIGDHSERKVYKTDRATRILLSAAKQSLKGAVPEIAEPLSVRDFLRENAALPSGTQGASDGQPLRLIAYCFEEETERRRSLGEVLKASDSREIVILIGPEGDFSPEEAQAAIQAGYHPVHFGPSRMRTETAALFAVSAVYQHFQL